jgi:hypothetical protein
MTWTIRVVVCLAVAGIVASVSTTGAAGARERERVLRGPEAREYVAQLKAANARFREVMQSAEADLRARGFRPVPDGIVVVDRFAAPSLVARVLDRISPTLAAQSVYQGDGRVIWAAWDDGDARTWEGNIYGESYSGGTYASANFQYSTDSGTWTPLTYWSSQTGTSAMSITPEGWHGGKCNGGNVTDHALRHSMENAASTCAAAAALCKFTSLNFFNCLGGACVGAIARGFIDELLAWSRECKMHCKWTNTSAGVWQCI